MKEQPAPRCGAIDIVFSFNKKSTVREIIIPRNAKPQEEDDVTYQTGQQESAVISRSALDVKR